MGARNPRLLEYTPYRTVKGMRTQPQSEIAVTLFKGSGSFHGKSKPRPFGVSSPGLRRFGPGLRFFGGIARASGSHRFAAPVLDVVLLLSKKSIAFCGFHAFSHFSNTPGAKVRVSKGFGAPNWLGLSFLWFCTKRRKGTEPQEHQQLCRRPREQLK